MEQSRATDAAAVREAQQLQTTCQEMRTQLESSHRDLRELRQLLHKSELGLQEATLKALQVGATFAGGCGSPAATGFCHS